MGRPVGEITKRFTLVVKHNGSESDDSIIEKVVGRSAAMSSIEDSQRVMSFTYRYQRSAANAVKRLSQAESDKIHFAYSTSISEK